MRDRYNVFLMKKKEKERKYPGFAEVWIHNMQTS